MYLQFTQSLAAMIQTGIRMLHDTHGALHGDPDG